MNRRKFLGSACGTGLATLATRRYARYLAAAEAHAGGPLAPRVAHHPPKANRLMVIFLTGGFSHVDTFDPKPLLARDHGQVVSAESLRETSSMPLLGSPFKFRRCGESGLEISEVFPSLQKVADELCVIRTLHTDILEHFQATLAMHTGSATIPLPSMGSWLSYALGTNNVNLPSYVVLCEHIPYAGAQVWDNHFLPPFHQGVRITPGPEPIPDLKSSARALPLVDLELAMLQDANRLHAEERPGDLNLLARMNTFEVARGMMQVAPEIFDIRGESASTLAEYGIVEGDGTSIAWQCLVARRLLENGVRVVELIDTGSQDNWDAHGDMDQHRGKAKRVDQPIAALLTDLRRRGLLEDTLVMICTEFGRTPWSDNGKGRNHWAKAFSCLLAGAGIRAGTTYGATDDYGASVAEKPCHVHDYHATILHLMGIDHERLTYHYAGRDYRLTDVDGQILSEILT